MPYLTFFIRTRAQRFAAPLTLLCILVFAVSNQFFPSAGKSFYSAAPASLVDQGSTRVYLALVTKNVVNPPPSSGLVYYVSPTGSDSNPGTAASPFKTIGKGVSMLQAGYTLYVKSGTYKPSAPVTISRSGTATSPITVATAPGEPSKAIINGDTNGDGTAEVPSQGSWSGLVQLNGSYIRFQNFEVAYSGGRGILSSGANNTMAGNIVHHIWGAGVNIFGAYNTIDGNTLYRTADSNYCGGAMGRKCNGNWGGGIAWGEPHSSVAPGKGAHAVVRNNTVYHTSGEGLLCMHSDYATIEGNVVYDNWALNIDLDQCSSATVQKNLAYYTPDTTWWRSSTRPGVGIMLSNEGIKDSSGRTYPIGHDRKVINNILVGNGSNFYFWTGDGGLTSSALVNDLIADNTLVNTLGTGGSGLKIDAGPHSNTRILNNIVLQASGTIAYAGSTKGITFGYNLWSKTPPSAFASSTNVIANPLLVDPNHTRTGGSVSSSWYKINTGSPAIDKAMSLSNVTIDYWNDTRSTKPDIGAHELVP